VRAQGSIARRVILGTATNAAGQGFIVLVQLALIPLIVHRVGATDFGIWVVAGAVASFAFLLDMGVSAALVKYVSEHDAKGEPGEAAAMASAALWLYAVVGIAVAAAGVPLGLALPKIFGAHGHTAHVVQWLAIFTALDVAVNVPAIAPGAVLKGLQRFPEANAISSAGALLNAAFVVALLLAGGGIVGVSAASAAASAITLAGALIAVRRLAPGYAPRGIRRDGPRVRRLFRFSRSIAAIQIAVRLQTRLDTIVIAAALSVAHVTPYNFAQRLADGTRLATDQFGKVLLPLATEVGATRERDRIRSLYLTSTRLTMGLALAIGIPLILLGSPILRAWVGSRFAGHGDLVTLLTLAALVDLPSYPAAAVLQSMERHQPIAWMALGSGVANLALSIALVGPLGAPGVAAATLIASSVEIFVFVLPYAARVIGVSARELGTQVVARLAAPAAALVVLVEVGRAALGTGSTGRLLAVIVIALAGYAAAYAAFASGPAERAAYRSTAAAFGRRWSRA
jgi:O-antigen/teichoic acid export membrane protein